MGNIPVPKAVVPPFYASLKGTMAMSQREASPPGGRTILTYGRAIVVGDCRRHDERTLRRTSASMILFGYRDCICAGHSGNVRIRRDELPDAVLLKFQ